MSTTAKTRAELMFGARCGRPPQGVNYATGRVIALGEELDAAQERLLVLPTEEGVACAWGIRPDSLVVVWDLTEGQHDTFHQGSYIRSGRPWADFARGACAHLAEGKRRLPGLDLVLFADLPRGEGLGTSAAYLIVLLRSLYESIGEYRSKWELCEVVPQIQWEWNDTDSGPLDPFLVAAAKPGQVLDVNCKELDYDVLSMPAGYALSSEDTGIPRSLPSSLYFARQLELAIAGDEVRALRPQLETLHDLRPHDLAALETHLRRPGRERLRHLVSGAARVADAAHAIVAGDMEELARVLNEQHRSLVEDWDSSQPEIETVRNEILASPGVLGATLQGLGWGGRLVVLRRAGGAEA
jgi:galactokinase